MVRGAAGSPAATFIGVERTPAHTSGNGGGEGEGGGGVRRRRLGFPPSRLGGDDAVQNVQVRQVKFKYFLSPIISVL